MHIKIVWCEGSDKRENLLTGSSRWKLFENLKVEGIPR